MNEHSEQRRKSSESPSQTANSISLQRSIQYTAARNVVRPVSFSAISLSSEDEKSGFVTAVNGGGGEGLSDVSPMQKVVAEFNERWYRFLDVDICRGDISELSLILICNIVRFLKKQQHFNSVVASITCDPNVWNAVMQNPALQEFLDPQKASASFPDSDHKIDEFVTEADFFSQSSRRIAFSKSEITRCGDDIGSIFHGLGSHGYDGDCLKKRSIMMSS
ncbi:hypothetical protein BC332_31676 [Capsicum chinense]|nr:hypothetical protein BC332_31676 [Capsicum chinense]